jgi:hypothetical protein
MNQKPNPEPRIYRSNYEFKCSKCGQPIKPQSPYYIEQKLITVAGDRIPDIRRVHVECADKECVKDGKD